MFRALCSPDQMPKSEPCGDVAGVSLNCLAITTLRFLFARLIAEKVADLNLYCRLLRVPGGYFF